MSLFKFDNPITFGQLVESTPVDETFNVAPAPQLIFGIYVATSFTGITV